ncbi:MAG TPA: M1 family metallopeptidase [Terracidiphilus sp.]|jgi:aminopeptidase N/puromycin-sensitive aminopeptidase|nr:M1 family metallopeptidase [Terracidiphilus sp.]
MCGSGSLLREAFGCAAVLACLVLLPSPAARAQRLSPDVRPTHYDLKLTPDLTAAKFAGVETIDLVLKSASTSITLNSLEIEYQGVTVTAGGKTQTATVASDTAKEQTTFTVPEEIPAGAATVHIRYTGILNNELRGFYLSKSKRRNYAVTQFESTDARRAFPSFDEPAMKASFTVTLVVDKGDTAISNTDIASDTPGPGAEKHTLRFGETPKMSTYLLAFLVGDFKCTNGEQDGVKIGVCATPDKMTMTHFGLDVAKFTLHYYDDYFGIHFPLKKLDMIGIPDFEAGAMENFGAITYRETALLTDPKTASIAAKKNVAEDITHEMAHQWFGDLVTMQWWDNIWLNEGFATWMEEKPVAAMFPEWNIPQDEVAGLDNTLNLDAQPTTRAIRATANTREEIEQMFDGISYGKAGAVLNMVENYVGKETFRQGVHKYLAAHEYGNATAEDFWGAQTEVSHKPVDKIMGGLVAQPGVPLLTFGEPENGRVSVEQRRFFLSPSGKADAAQKWTVPVCFKTRAGQQCEVLTPESTSLKAPADGLFFANAGGVGYFRTSYPADKYAALVAGVETDLKPTERISLIGDEWAKVRANDATVGDYLNLVAAVKADPNAPVVGAALGNVGLIYERVAATEQEKAAIGQWLRANFSPEYAKLGPPQANDAPNTRELRAELLGVLGDYAKDPEALTEAHALAEKYLNDPASVDATLGQTALAIAARNGDAKLFDKMQHVYETSTNPEFSETALQLLALFEDPALEERALEYATTNKVRNQDAAFQFAIPLQTDATRERAWAFIKSHWDTVHALLTPEMGSALVRSTGAFCSVEARDDVQKFFAAHPVASADRAVKHSIEHINGCMELRQLQEGNLKAWLEKQAAASGE